VIELSVSTSAAHEEKQIKFGTYQPKTLISPAKTKAAYDAEQKENFAHVVSADS
jgi:hypothetical protein